MLEADHPENFDGSSAAPNSKRRCRVGFWHFAELSKSANVRFAPEAALRSRQDEVQSSLDRVEKSVFADHKNFSGSCVLHAATTTSFRTRIPIPCHPVPLSPSDSSQPSELCLHFRIYKNGCGRFSANLTCETASIVSCLRVPLNDYKFGRRGAETPCIRRAHLIEIRTRLRPLTTPIG